MGAGVQEASLRSLGLTVYAPSFLFGVGQGAVLPVVALAARDAGASVAGAGLIVALLGVGAMVFDLPAGSLVARLGERRAMVVGTALLVVSLVGCVLATSALVFAACTAGVGCGWAMWMLARLSFVGAVVPQHLRGRALSTLGGVHRVGSFTGPFLGAAAIASLGLDGAYLVHVVLAVAGCAVLVLAPDPQGAPAEVHAPVGLLHVAAAHRRVLATAGVAPLVIGLLRAGRHAVLPLWGASQGLDAAQVALVFGLAGGLDMLLFYPAGWVSDRYGRKAVALPCMGLLALGFLLLPLARDLPSIVAVALVMGLGNGLGSGIVMTLGADVAPGQGRAQFLGMWRLVGDTGSAGGPLLTAAVAGAASLASASLVVGAVGLVGAAAVAALVPEPLRRPR